MKVCLIGTSNSIFKDGYASAFRDDPRVTNFEKYSIGASPSIIIPYFIESIDFSKFDYVVFDTAINDRNYYKHGSILKSQIREFVEWGVHSAHEAGCNTALLVMPSKKGFGKETISGKIYRKIANETGAVLLDGFEYIENYCDVESVHLDACFIDNFHVVKPIARKMGYSLIDKMHLNATVAKVKKHQKFCYYSIDLSCHANKVVTRKTSLAEQRLAVLTGDDSIDIYARSPLDQVVGISFNAAYSQSAIVCSTVPSMIKNLKTKYFSSGKDLLTIVSPVTGEYVCGNSGKISIRLAEAGEVETEVSRFDKIAECMVRSGDVEIGSLIMKAHV